MATERLRFGIWRDTDLPLAEAIWGDPVVTALTGGPFGSEAVAERLASEIAGWRRHGIQYWPIFQPGGTALVGCCGLRPRDAAERVAELGFQLCRRAWGRGYATEAARAVVGWARDRGFAALIAGHHPANEASRRTILRLGFVRTHDELYPPTGVMEPCYRLRL